MVQTNDFWTVRGHNTVQTVGPSELLTVRIFDGPDGARPWSREPAGGPDRQDTSGTAVFVGLARLGGNGQS